LEVPGLRLGSNETIQSVEQVRERTRQVCQAVGKGGGFVMETGIGEMEGSKPELGKAWVDATKEFGVY
jgi:uroporphyrinogen-III decarboxylase